MDDERREQLLKMDEFDASNLSREEWYDRARLLREKAGEEMLSRIKISSNSYSGETNTSNLHFWRPGHPAYDSLHSEKDLKKHNRN